MLNANVAASTPALPGGTIMSRLVYRSGPKEVQGWVQSCLAERFSRKLQVAILKAKQSARDEQDIF